MVKTDIITTDSFDHIKIERKMLETVKNPFMMYLNCAFHDDERIYLVMPFIQGGDLFTHLKREIRFKEDRVKFYAAQVAYAFGYLHDREYIYRDLKPENILLNIDGYIVLTDFGSTKSLEKDKLSNSFVGTPDYMSPEIL
jgi:serine/threonine protein kinase